MRAFGLQMADLFVTSARDEYSRRKWRKFSTRRRKHAERMFRRNQLPFGSVVKTAALALAAFISRKRGELPTFGPFG